MGSEKETNSKNHSKIHLISIILCAILVTAVVSVLVIQNANGGYDTIKDDGKRMAPETKLIYEMSMNQNNSTIKGIATYEVLAQNSNGYLYRLSYDLYYPDGTPYEVENRIRLTNDGDTEFITEGTENISTLFGNFKASYVEYALGGKFYRDYYNPFTSIMYLSVSSDSSSKVELVLIDAVWQQVNEYKPSNWMGLELTFSVMGTSNGTAISGTNVETIVAEDGNGWFGTRSVFSYEDYSVVSYSFGETSSSKLQKTGKTSLDTMDGRKDVSVYSLRIENVNNTYYIDDENGTCYKKILTSDKESLTMNLIAQRTDTSFIHSEA